MQVKKCIEEGALFAWENMYMYHGTTSASKIYAQILFSG